MSAKYSKSSKIQYNFTKPQLTNFYFFLFQFFGRFIGLDLYPSSYKYASHSDDQLLIFNTNSLPFDGAFTLKDQNVSKNLLKLWTDFVKNESIPHWFPLSKDNLRRLEISSYGLQMIPTDKAMLNFWTNNILPLLNHTNTQHKSFHENSNLHNLGNKDEL